MIETIFIADILFFGGYMGFCDHFGWLMEEKLMIVSIIVEILVIFYGFRVLAIFFVRKSLFYISTFIFHWNIQKTKFEVTKIRHFVSLTTRFTFEFQKAVKIVSSTKCALNRNQTHNPQPTYIQNTYSQYIFIHCFYCVQLFAIYLSQLLFSFLSLHKKKFRVGFVCLFFIFQLKYNFSGIFIGYLWKEIHVDAFSFSSSFFVCFLKGRASCALTVPGDNVRIYWDFFLVCWEIFYSKKEEIEKN